MAMACLWANGQCLDLKSDNLELNYWNHVLAPLCDHENYLIDRLNKEVDSSLGNDFILGATNNDQTAFKSLLSKNKNPSNINGTNGFNTSIGNYTKKNLDQFKLGYLDGLSYTRWNDFLYDIGDGSFADHSKYSNSLGQYFKYQDFQEFSKTLTVDQCYDKFFKKFTPWMEFFHKPLLSKKKKPSAMSINFLGYLKSDEQNLQNPLYTISRGPNGNLMGFKGPYTIDGRQLYVGKNIDENGLIIDDQPYYFFGMAPFKTNFYKGKTNVYSKSIFNGKSWDWQCESLLNDTNFLNNDGDNKYFQCNNNQKDLNDFLINGNHFNKKTVNIMGYVAQPIEKKNYPYNFTNINYKSFNNIHTQWGPVIMNFVDFLWGSRPFSGELLAKEINVMGIMINIKNFIEVESQNFVNQFNQQVEFLSWTLDGTSYGKLHTPVLDRTFHNHQGDFVVSSFFNFFHIFSNIKYPFLSPKQIIGLSDSLPSKNLKPIFIGFNNTNFLWLKTGSNQNPMDYTTRVPNGTLWNGHMMSFHQSKSLIFPITEDFFTIYGRTTQQLGASDGYKKNIYDDGIFDYWLKSNNFNDFLGLENVNRMSSLKDFNSYRILSYILKGVSNRNLSEVNTDGKIDHRSSDQNTRTTSVRILLDYFKENFDFLNKNQEFHYNNKDVYILKNLFNQSQEHLNETMRSIENTTYDVTEGIHGVNFFETILLNVKILENQRFTSINNNSLLNQTTFVPTIHLKPQGKLLWNATELNNDGSFLGCTNDQCFFLNYNGLPIKQSQEKPWNLYKANQFNGTDFSFFQWGVTNQWLFHANNNSYKCIFVFVDGLQYIKKSLGLMCSNKISNEMAFIYDMETKFIYYPSTTKSPYGVVNTYGGDKIHIHSDSQRGFSEVFFHQYPQGYFTSVPSETIFVQDLSNTTIEIFNDMIGWNQEHWIFWDGPLEFNKKPNDDFFWSSSIIGDGSSGLVKICNWDANKNQWCVDGDLESLLIYYNQNYENIPVNINQLNPVNSSLGHWLLSNKNFVKVNKFFKFLRPKITQGYTFDYLWGSLLSCNLIIDNWFEEGKSLWPLANYCSDGNQLKFIELMGYPQWDPIEKSMKKSTTQWFFCLGKLPCRVTYEKIICDGIHCFHGNVLMNNNWIDKLNDPQLINILKKQLNLNINFLVAFHPNHQYYFSAINYSLEGLLTIPYELAIVQAYKNQQLYWNLGFTLFNGLGPLITWFVFYKWINSQKKTCYKYFFLFHGLWLIPYGTALVRDVFLVVSDDFNLGNKYIYDKKNYTNFYISMGVHGLFLFTHGLTVFLFSWKKFFKKFINLIPWINNPLSLGEYPKKIQNHYLLGINGVFALAYGLFIFNNPLLPSSFGEFIVQ
jgi:hypothetical protein